MLRLRNFIFWSAAAHLIAIYTFAVLAGRVVEHVVNHTAVHIRAVHHKESPKPPPKAVAIPQPKVAIPVPKPVHRKKIAADIPPPPPVVEQPQVSTAIDQPVSDEPAGPAGEGVEGSGTSDSGPVAQAVDQTRAPQLVTSSVHKPEYTKEALRARLQGEFPIDVHLSADGTVLEVELVKPVGYGMDERIIAAIKGAKFLPQLNADGTGHETWFTPQFRLEIP